MQGTLKVIAIASIWVSAFAGITLMRVTQNVSLGGELQSFLAEEGIPGAVVAIGDIGETPALLALGTADGHRPMRVDDRFRLASLSKPVTAAAALRLVRDGRLSLDAPQPAIGHGITVRDLLRHSGGWDREATFEPLADPDAAARHRFADAPDCMAIARRMTDIQFQPGSRYSYSNIGYCWLGALIERASGESYEDYVREAVLRPRGARLAYEGESTVAYLNGRDSADYRLLGPGGAWVGTAADYWRFASGPIDPAVRDMPPYASEGLPFYGLGWEVWPDGTLAHTGAIHGEFALVMRTRDEVTVVIMNGRPRDDLAALSRLTRILRHHS